jgi:hypothetical protein
MAIKRRTDLTADYVRSLLDYDPVTGIFTWRVSRGTVAAGRVAGSPCKGGYLNISIDGVLYRAHRLAVLHVTGEWPAEDVDHKNRSRASNEWGNIRPATRQQNCQNKSLRKDSTSGAPGVSFKTREQKWSAYITEPITRRRKWLGEFRSKDEAIAARRAAESAMFGEFRVGAAA